MPLTASPASSLASAVVFGSQSYQPSPKLACPCQNSLLRHIAVVVLAVNKTRTISIGVESLTLKQDVPSNLQAVIHCEIVRQAARVIAMDKERLRSGDRACVRFRFLQRPEFLTAGTRLVFREGKTKGIGMVVGTE